LGKNKDFKRRRGQIQKEKPPKDSPVCYGVGKNSKTQIDKKKKSGKLKRYRGDRGAISEKPRLK